MKKLVVALAMFLGLNSAHANQTDLIGIGLRLGEPTGLTLKYWATNKVAVDFDVAYSYSHAYLVGGDLLFHGRYRSVRPYIGLGAQVALFQCGYYDNWYGYHYRLRNSAGLAVRVPVGIEFIPRETPFGIFLEVAPGVSIIPDVNGFIQASVGARFYF